jgi:uroporphyrinogen-III synthase
MFVYKSRTKFNKSEILGVRVANILKKKFGNNFLKKIKFPKKLTFLLTRSMKQSNELKKNINLKNFNFLNCPMLKIKPIKLTKNKIKEIKVADAIIFSSANAVNISSNYLKSFPNKIFCVGKDTKTECFKNNIKNVSSSDGNINDLINLITKKIKDRSKKLVYISAKQTAVNLPLILKSKKIYVKKIVIYESKKIKTIQKPILDLIRLNKLNFVTFFSKKTAITFNQLILKYKLQRYLMNMECISLSNSIEQIAKKNNFKKYYVSSNPDRKSFLKLINFLHKTI